ETLFMPSDMEVLNDLVLSITDLAKLEIFNMTMGDELYSWSNPSLNNGIFIDDDSLLISKTSSPGNSGVLDIINWKTGEITPLNDEYFYVLDMEIYRPTGKLYILGLKENHGEIQLSVTERSLDNINNARTLVELDREDYNSQIYISPNGKVFISLDNIGLLEINGRRTITWNTPRDVNAMDFWGSQAVLLYDDNSIAFWDRSDRTELMRLTLFQDLSWLVVKSDNKAYFYSPGARDNFSVYRVIQR
ncbi:MAG: hypothetical protein PF447_04325, partial [Spirochaetaceae bacterium]|nr:hypothetical protein [Spirochaetaceae bacterium]